MENAAPAAPETANSAAVNATAMALVAAETGLDASGLRDEATLAEVRRGQPDERGDGGEAARAAGNRRQRQLVLRVADPRGPVGGAAGVPLFAGGHSG